MSIDNPDASPGGNTSTSADLQSQAKQDLGRVTDKAKHDLDAVTRRAAEDVRELSHEAGAKVGEAKEKAKSFAADQKDLAAAQISGIASAIGKVADELNGSDQQTVGRYARDLANGVASLGRTVENRDVDDLMGLAQDFGRRQPVAFLGAAALAGFVASRFAMASAQRRDSKVSSAPSFGDGQSAGVSGEKSQDSGSGTSSTYGSDRFGSTRSGDF